MNYLILKLWLLMSIILIYNHALVVADTQVQGCDPGSEEFDNSLLRKLRNDWSNGFKEMFTFFNSLNKTMTTLTGKIQNLEAQAILNIKNIANLQEDVAGIKFKIESTAANQTAVISDTETIASNYSNFHISQEDLTAKLAELESSVTLHTGKSFNGSSLSEIISLVSGAGDQGHYTAVVFANYLDETITDFTIYDEHDTTFNPAPTSIPALTEEVFTFYERACCYVYTSFSYVIPSNGARVAAISQAGAWVTGLAFVSPGTDMKAYYESTQGINGSSVYECCDHEDRNISVGYHNLYARLFARSDGGAKTTLRIEIMNLS